MMYCDFCKAPNPKQEFPCGDFRMPPEEPEHWSRGAWMACDFCAELVASDQRFELATRSIETYANMTGSVLDPSEYEELLAVITEGHRRFFENRILDG